MKEYHRAMTRFVVKGLHTFATVDAFEFWQVYMLFSNFCHLLMCQDLLELFSGNVIFSNATFFFLKDRIQTRNTYWICSKREDYKG